MTYYPSQDTNEPHYLIDEAAQRLSLPVRALVGRINAGKVKTKFNGRHNFISDSEIERVSGELQREAEATAAAEQEQQKAQEQVVVRDEIARDMKHLNERAKKIGMEFLAED